VRAVDLATRADQLVEMISAGDSKGASKLLKSHLDTAERLLVAAVGSASL
jgi:DNA-binding GntR family transcriptional regulator